METVIFIFAALLVGIAIAKLYPYLKDFSVSPEEKAKVQEILVDTTKEIIQIASSKTDEELVLSITDITMKKLENENIKGFRREDIELMAKIIVDKLKDFLVEN